MPKETQTDQIGSNVTDSTPAILRPAEAAKVLLVSTEWLKRDRMAGGGVPFFRVGRQARYRKADIDAWIEAQMIGSSAA